MKALTKAVRLEVKELTETGAFAGYASVFGVEDSYQDVVQAGAYKATLAARGTKGIKLLHEHDPAQPIGVWTELSEDGHGLLAKGQLLIEALAKAREVYALLKAGVIDGLSIGYRVVKSRSDRAAGTRILEELDLREISVVMFPACEPATIGAVKGQLPTEREFERWLMQDAGFSRSQARRIIADGFKAIQAKPGAGDEGEVQQAIDWGDLTRGLERLSQSIR